MRTRRIVSYDRAYGPVAGAHIRRLIARIGNLASQAAKKAKKASR